MNNEQVLDRLNQAELILAGLGEDFNRGRYLLQDEEYIKGREKLKDAGLHWLIPAWEEYRAVKSQAVSEALEKLKALLEGKNYFLVSVAFNSEIGCAGWKPGRLVMPCGSVVIKQCREGCPDVLSEVTEEDGERLAEVFRRLRSGELPQDEFRELGHCPECGAPLVLNNIYAENYNENGYMQQWKTYTKWLQGTLNHRLAVLELGVGMRFPSVIRWPFEKIAFFNNKAYFCRVNDKLYQLTEELSQKGCGISRNAIDWLNGL